MLNKKFQTVQNSLANYNWVDIADGTGMVLFYGAASLNSVGTTYFLTQNQIYSEANSFEMISSVFNTGSFVKCLDQDVDLTSFNLPQMLRGTAIINICSRGILPTGASTKEYHLIAILKKVSDGVETTLGSVQTSARVVSADPTIECLLITIAKTHFKKADILRLTIEGYGKNYAGSDSGQIAVGIDPMNRDGTYIIPSTDAPTSTTQLKVWIPFNIDI